MEDSLSQESWNCIVHATTPAEYCCLGCRSRLLLCAECKRAHVSSTGHAVDSCKDAGLSLMQREIEGGDTAQRLLKSLAGELGSAVEEFKSGILKRVQDFCYTKCAEARGRLQKLETEGKFAELYFCAKDIERKGQEETRAFVSAVADDEVRKLREVLRGKLDGAAMLRGTDGLRTSPVKRDGNEETKRVEATPSKPMFAAYTKKETLKTTEGAKEEEVVAQFEKADVRGCKMIYAPSGAGNRTAEMIAKLVSTAPSISAFYLSGYSISDRGACAVALAVGNKNVEKFYLSGESVSDSGIIAVANAIKSNRNISAFCIDCDNMTYKSVSKLAKVIEEGTNISAVYLGASNLSDKGVQEIAAAVEINRNISAIYLDSGDMTDSGGVSMAHALEANNNISSFSLASSNLSDKTAFAVASAVDKNANISKFYLDGAGISDEGAKKLAAAMRKNQHITSVYLVCMGLTRNGLSVIFEAVASHAAVRSVNMFLPGCEKVTEVDIYYWLEMVQGLGQRLKLRFECEEKYLDDVCENGRWKGKFAELRVVDSVQSLFESEVMLGIPE